MASVRFAIAAVDDSVSDGTQTATITAEATDPFTDERIAAGGASADLDVLDDDGDSLSITLDTALITENGTAIGTVWRDAEDISSPLVVDLASSDTGEATVRHALQSRRVHRPQFVNRLP